MRTSFNFKKSIMSKYLKEWMKAASAEQQEDLASRIGSSRNYLYHLAGGFRHASPELASAIERATADMDKKHSLPLIFRTDLSPACAGCDFAKKCLGKNASRK